MMELWGMRSTPLFPLLPNTLCQGVVTSGRVLYMGQIELIDRVQTNDIY